MFLRRLILVVVLLAAQMAVGVHALEHLTGQQDGHLPGQSCSVCLTAHNLSAAAVSYPPVIPDVVANHVLVQFTPSGRLSVPAYPARQRGPPTA